MNHHHYYSRRLQNQLLFLSRPTLVARNSQDVPRPALGEVRLRLVDLGLNDDRALSAIHAALDGTRNVHLQLPLLTVEGEYKDRNTC